MLDSVVEPWIVDTQEPEKATLSFLDRVYVERGTRDDWLLLEGLHYKAHGVTPGAHYFRLVLDGETIGVLMMASPKLLLKERHVMFPKLKPQRDTRIANQKRMKWINANMSIVARCVVDTMYRGAGLAYRFANIASRMEGKRFIEIQSSMSKYNQFAQKAGFKFCPPMKSNKYEVGIKFFRAMFDTDPADTEGLIEEIMSKPEVERDFLDAELRKFYRKNSMLENTGKALIDDFGDKRVARLPLRELVYQTQQMVLASPLYGVYQNPDVGRELPERIPVLAFDIQAPNEPLDVEAVNV